MTEAPLVPTAELGHLALVLALGLCVVAAVAAVLGARRGDLRALLVARRSLLGAACCSTAAVLILLLAFVFGDYSLEFVWQTSSSQTPLFYRVTGIWGGQAGSLLFWSWLMTVYAALALAGPWPADRTLLPGFIVVTALVSGFFLGLTSFVANPFTRIVIDGAVTRVAEGNGLNPLLQHPGMAFHPPALYLGFTGMVIPFAFGMAALAARRTDATWIRASRRWMLIAWAFLSIGLALGGRWAYDVLGWGGYWAWDPVENAAFMPWLAATAFLHSVMIQERRGSFKVWNMALIILSFALVVIGTFLTRAGLVSSVHSFAKSDIGPYFLVFTSGVLVASLALLWSRLPDLQSREPLEQLVSRESAFLGNNLLFMGILFAVFWGTLFPLFSEILTDQRLTVGKPYFNRVTAPLFCLLLLLMAIAPSVGWRRSEPRRVLAQLAGPALTTALITALLFAAGLRRPLAVIGIAIGLFALVATVVEIGRGVAARHRRGEAWWTAAFQLFARGRRRYGGYVVHVGIAVMAIGIVGSHVYQEERDVALKVGEQVALGGFNFTFRGVEDFQAADRQGIAGLLDASRDGRALGRLKPVKAVPNLKPDQPMTLPSVIGRPLEDLYALMTAYDPATGQGTFKLYINPLIGWVWAGLLILVAGTLVAAWPDRQAERALAAELRRLLGPRGAEA
jgi:cytochrome c-type biogenesis protein CcmF